MCEHQDVSYLSGINLKDFFCQKYPLLAEHSLSYVCHYKSGILTLDPQNFKTPLSSDFYFSDL